MEFRDVVRQRRMVRSFEERPLDPAALTAVLKSGLRAPSAGFTQGVELVVLEGAEQTRTFWETTTTPEWRATGARSLGVMRAPAVILPLTGPSAYLERYREPDKVGSPLADADGWPVPYWTVDAAFATMLMLLSAVDLGLGALFFRIHTGEDQLMATLGVPPGMRPIGALALGHPAPDTPSASLIRGRRPDEQAIHRGHW